MEYMPEWFGVLILCSGQIGKELSFNLPMVPDKPKMCPYYIEEKGCPGTDNPYNCPSNTDSNCKIVDKAKEFGKLENI